METKQRNSALHLNGFASSQIIFKTIVRELRNTVTARRKKQFKNLVSMG